MHLPRLADPALIDRIMASSSPVRFGLVGFGAWGKMHAHSITLTQEAVLAAIVAPSDASRAEARQLYPEAQVFATHEDMLANVPLDIVDIVTPSHTHREIAEAAFAKGMHVLLEKPMAITMADCRAIVDASKAAGKQLAVGHELRLSSQWGLIKDLIRRGTIGDPRYVLVELSRKPYRLGASGWRYDASRVGSWVLEEPIHFFDLARWYLEGSGDPVELHAVANAIDPARAGLFDNFTATMRYADGAYAVVSQTLAAIEHHQTVKVTGTKGALWAGWSGALDRTLEPSYFLKVFANDTLENVQIEKHSGEVFELREEIAMCVRMVRGEGMPIASGEDGLWSAGLCLAAEQSVASGQIVDVRKFLDSNA
jgi:myo-inositol 2-dehydrogenase/D-chiro-inositol 1-dehydrogenase